MMALRRVLETRVANSKQGGKGPPAVKALAHPILHLQQTVGNQKLQQLLKPHALQAKLRTSQPGDVYEQEADRVAEQVIHQPVAVPVAQRASAPSCAAGGCPCAACAGDHDERVQRKAVPVVGPEDASLPDSFLEGLGPGHPLDPATRAFFEARLGYGLSEVRVHDDTRANESARSVNALAYTVGRHVVFAAGQYNPQAGRRLLAHELVHVAQQRAAEPLDLDTRSVPIRQHSQAPLLSGAWVSCAEPPQCPAREPGEVSRSFGDLRIGGLTSPTSGEIVSGFAVGLNDASSLPRNSAWKQFAANITASTDRWEILGFSDCEGRTERNERLRARRARAVFLNLPSGAKSKIDSVSGAPLTDCVASNDTEANRRFNRSVVFSQTESRVDFEDQEVKGSKCPPAAPSIAADLSEYVSLLICAETRMGLPPREMLTVFRQIYYGQPWSTSTTSKWDNVITGSPVVGDPRGRLGAALFVSLQRSQEVAGIDVGHLFAGLEAMTNPQPSVSFFAGLATVSMPNEEFATWGGDLGSAAAAFVACGNLGSQAASKSECGSMPPQSLAFYLLLLAPSQDLEGDIDPFIVRASELGIPCTGSSQQTFTPSRPMSQVLHDTYIDPSSTLGKAHANRYRCMLELLGASISGKTVTNSSSITPALAGRVSSFADAFFFKIAGSTSDISDRMKMGAASVNAVEYFITYLESRL